MSSSYVLIKIHDSDNVAIILNQGGAPKGAELPGGITLIEDVPQGHKVALVDIETRRASASLQRSGGLRQA